MRYTIRYREEFEAEVDAENRDEAIRKLCNNECKIRVVNELWDEYFAVIDENGKEANRDETKICN